MTEAIQKHDSLELAFVWNRSKDVLDGLDRDVVLDDLSDCASRKPDLIVEVSHPVIVKQVVISSRTFQFATRGHCIKVK